MTSTRPNLARRLAVLAVPVVAMLALFADPVRAAPAASTRAFETPEAAMNAFGDALAGSNEPALKAMLGANFRDYIPTLGEDALYRFLEAWAQSHTIKSESDSKALIAVGRDGWTLPIPIVKSKAGWQFDMQAGADEMRTRRIGRNELAVMQTLLAFRDAQFEYATVDRDGKGILHYADKLVSSPGKKDGLYWPTKAGEQPSPIGPRLAEAFTRASSSMGYHGYRYKLLTAQTANAPGGAFNYVAKGKLFGGFAVVAWPARYGDTGVMTFMVSHEGQIYERDLGPDTATKATAMKSFDPGPGWAKVTP
jgi:hypothetical protein